MTQALRGASVSIKAKFPLGRLVATSNLVARVSPADVRAAVQRHAQCDWGEVCESDRAMNDQGLLDGSRLMSVYSSSTGEAFWIITEWDRSVTTVLLPEDY